VKDYYQILGVSEDCSEADIKSAFRKLAFRHHPDTNPGNEKQAEANFKEVNEAYGVLGDSAKRRQYDLARKGQFAGTGYDTGYQGFGYSQQDIFNGLFTNRAMLDELNRMFAQAGLRFDKEFLNRVFFPGGGVTYQFYTSPGGASHTRTANQRYPYMSTYKSGWIERLFSKIAVKIGKLVLGRLFGFRYDSLPGQNLDHHTELEISSTEAAAGGEKQIAYQRGGQTKKLMVKVPSGVRPGTRIRLKGMGMVAGGKSGDLYLHIKIKG